MVATAEVPISSSAVGIIYAGEDSQSQPCPLESIEIEEQHRSLGSALKPIVDEFEINLQIDEEEAQFSLLGEEAVQEPEEIVQSYYCSKAVSEDDPNFLLKTITLYPSKPKVPAWLIAVDES